MTYLETVERQRLTALQGIHDELVRLNDTFEALFEGFAAMRAEFKKSAEAMFGVPPSAPCCPEPEPKAQPVCPCCMQTTLISSPGSGFLCVSCGAILDADMRVLVAPPPRLT